MVAIKDSLCEFDKFYQMVIETTSMTKYRVGGGAITTEHLSCVCVLCEDKSLFCVVKDKWWPLKMVCVSGRFCCLQPILAGGAHEED